MKNRKIGFCFSVILMLLMTACSAPGTGTSLPEPLPSTTGVPGNVEESNSPYQFYICGIAGESEWPNLSGIARYETKIENTGEDYQYPQQASVTVGDKVFTGELHAHSSVYHGAGFSFSYDRKGFLDYFNLYSSFDVSQYNAPIADTPEKCIALAKTWMETLFDISDYEVFISNTYDSGGQTHTVVMFQKYLAGVATYDRATVTFADGYFEVYNAYKIGSIPAQTPQPFDMAVIEATLSEMLEEIYAEWKGTKYEVIYGEPSFMLQMTKAGELELICEINIRVREPFSDPNPNEWYIEHPAGLLFIITQ